MKCLEKLYIKAIKCLLGVRASTMNDLCLVELGYAPLKVLVKGKQKRFFDNMISSRQGMQGDPLIFALGLTYSGGGSTSRYLNDLSHCNDIFDSGWRTLWTSGATSEFVYQF